MPSSKSGPANDFPIARVAASDSGVLAIAKRSSIKSGVISFWSYTMIRRNASRFSRVGSYENLPRSFTPSVGSGATGVVKRKPHSGAAAKRITHQRSAFDAEVVEQVQQSGGAVAVVLLMLGVLVGVPVAGLVDGEHVKVLRQHADVAAEVGPARRTGPAAVQQHDRPPMTGTRLVVVQPHVVANLRVARGRFECDLLLLCGFGGE